MKKYITTDKHPELKEGIIIEYEAGNWSSLNGWVYIKKNDLQVSIEQGYIKEVEEKEFTKSDMVDFARMFFINYTGDYFDTEFCRKLLTHDFMQSNDG